MPPRRNRRDPICFNPYLYRNRNLVERFFNRIKHCRRIATRYEKRAVSVLTFVKLAAIRIWLRVYESTAWSTRRSIKACGGVQVSGMNWLAHRHIS